MKKYKINIPKGKKVTSREVKGNDIVIHLSDEFVPKDGDVCYVETSYNKVGYIFIFKPNKNGVKDGLYCYRPYLFINNTKKCIFYFSGFVTSHADKVRLATEEEKKLFFDKLKEECNQTFNFETKQFEDIRWRAEKGCRYECIIVDDEGVRIAEFTDFRGFVDDGCFNSGNYYNPADHEKTQLRVDEINAIIKRR